MSGLRKLVKKAFTPMTIMVIPHSNRKPFNLKIPSIGIIASLFFWIVGSVYLITIAVNTLEYRFMKEKLNYYSNQFVELKATMAALKKAEMEFSRLFSLGAKDKVLENLPQDYADDRGSIDIEALTAQIKNTLESVQGIKEYLNEQKDIYMATPRGWPVPGNVTSHYGTRESPIHGGSDFHSGMDISVPQGTPVKSTAEGVVTFSGWSGGSGNLVAIEHGFGYSTFYAHNRVNLVKVGQRVNRGDVIAHAGATGLTTGSHSHYEIWKDGKHINPKPFIEGKR